MRKKSNVFPPHTVDGAWRAHVIGAGTVAGLLVLSLIRPLRVAGIGGRRISELYGFIQLARSFRF